MHSLSVILVCIAALGSSLVEAGPQHSRRDMRSPLEKRSTNCDGSFMCGSIDGEKCLKAMDKIDAEKLYNTRGSSDDTGVCNENCGIFVQGDDCDLTGKEMFDGLDELWNKEGCFDCGSKKYDDGCLLTVNYVDGC